MKITIEHYNYMKQRIDALPRLTVENAAYNAQNNPRAKDKDKFYRWHLFHLGNLSAYACDTLYSYCDDGHIDTALRRIIAELKIPLTKQL